MCTSRELAAGLQLPAQVADVDGEGVGVRPEVLSPHQFEDQLAGEYLAGVAHEEFEQGRFGTAELQRAAPAAPGPGRRVEHEVGEAERGGAAGRGRRPPQQRADPRDQLVQGERLDEVVVGARLQAVDALADGVERGQDEDGRTVAHRAQLPADAEAVEDGHHDVEDDRVRLPGRHLGEAREPVRRAPHLVPLDRESVLDGCPHLRLVVDDEDALPARTACTACTARGVLGTHGAKTAKGI
ncbi:hypothetical protein GCM10020254_81320 [Streptomyces goshikiensis]